MKSRKKWVVCICGYRVRTTQYTSAFSEVGRAVEGGITVILKAFILDVSKKEDYQRTFFLFMEI